MSSVRELAVISVSDKSGLVGLAKTLLSLRRIDIVASGGTFKFLSEHGVQATQISSFTGADELLNGRVKTLHPKLYAGILATSNDADELSSKGWPPVRFVVCNLYPFERVVSNKDLSDEVAIENIDIGGVALIRAAAKNHNLVTVLVDPNDYEWVLNEIAHSSDNSTTPATRRKLALKAFQWTSYYDSLIADYMRDAYFGPEWITPRYGTNPHQNVRHIFTAHPMSLGLPLSVVNGHPSYVNILDALNAWSLVRELKKVLNTAAAASFKHVSPAGVALSGDRLSRDEARAFLVDDAKSPLSPLAVAYAKARGCDRLSSFGDFIALSDACDVSTAQLIARDVSDGVVAPNFHPDALTVLKKKKAGNYCILKIDDAFEPHEWETRTVFGLNMRQQRNGAILDPQSLLKSIVVNGDAFNDDVARSMILATITCKYTQSNAVCLATNNQTIGIGAGQQSRIQCVRLACDKAENWWLRFHPKVLQLSFKDGVKRADKTNAIDAYIRASEDDLGDFQYLKNTFRTEPELLSLKEKQDWIKQLNGVSLSSDAFFPFADSIHRAHQSGVDYVVCPKGSIHDNLIVEACKSKKILLALTDIRLFHH